MLAGLEVAALWLVWYPSHYRQEVRRNPSRVDLSGRKPL